MYRLFLKQSFDSLIALGILIIILPLLLLITLLLLFANKGKPFFIQERPGKNGKLFNLIKFRTMVDLSNSEGIPLSDNQRTTRLGKWLRNTSVDELPQLINVLHGDMSLVGPRPLLKDYLPLYSNYQARRHEVKPGITGWAQVNGRNAITWNEKFKLDVWYVDNLTFKLDLKIIAKTILKVLSQQEINSSDKFTMEVFHGNN
jgi:lipopolysaccharide/colanic/teichoic acid biosynthesis glycosyltransferase